MSPKAHLDRSNPCIYGMKRQIIPLLSPWKGCFPPPTFRQVMVFWNPSTLLGGEKPRLLKIPYMIRNTHNVRILHSCCILGSLIKVTLWWNREWAVSLHWLRCSWSLKMATETGFFCIPTTCVFNSVDNTKLSCYSLPPTQHYSFFRKLPLLWLWLTHPV